MGSRFELGEEPGRWYLAGVSVHNGDLVEVLEKGGGWRPLRLEGMPREIWGYPRDGGEPVEVSPDGEFRWPAG